MLKNKKPKYYLSSVPLLERHGRESIGLGPKRGEFEFEFDLEQVTWSLRPSLSFKSRIITSVLPTPHLVIVKTNLDNTWGKCL